MSNHDFRNIDIEAFADIFRMRAAASTDSGNQRNTYCIHRKVECIGLADGVTYKYNDDLGKKIFRGEVLHAVAKF